MVILSIATRALWLLVVVLFPQPAQPQTIGLEALLDRKILALHQTMTEVQRYTEARVPELKSVKTRKDWELYSQQIRRDLLDQVIFRGEAAGWRDASGKVEWLETIDGGPEYRIKKLRYEALPDLWIPALLYEPIKLEGKTPLILNVNGHDPHGKAAEYKQIRCINQAKRGMLALNVEWFGMGQLHTPGFGHYKMNQLDLCGASGLAPFYLAMSRALDLLLALPNADPERLAVTGLSGGGWQTIFISSLDTRVKLANPVAGYSSYRTRAQHLKDLGDSEQTPNDLATIADYTHLTALMAPRPTLLTFNDSDSCCFEAGYALAPLEAAGKPIFRLYDREAAFRTHINRDGGTHNYGKDNREAFYRMVGDFFYPVDKSYSAEEITCDQEVKRAEQLTVELPKDNHDFNRLALSLCERLPHQADLPTDRFGAEKWQAAQREQLREVVRAKDFSVTAEQIGDDEKGGLKATYWKLRMGNSWTVPAVELIRGEAKETAILIGDGGRKSLRDQVEALLRSNFRVLAVDPLCLGESTIQEQVELKDEKNDGRDKNGWNAEPWNSLFGLLLSAVGDRPLGIQASQLMAVARWDQMRHGQPVMLVAVGPRVSTMALVAAALETRSIGQVKLTGALGSLKELIELNRGVDEYPEMLCFGLLKHHDIKQLAALVAPRPVVFHAPSDRVRTDLSNLKSWYATLGSEVDLFQ